MGWFTSECKVNTDGIPIICVEEDFEWPEKEGEWGKWHGKKTCYRDDKNDKIKHGEYEATYVASFWRGPFYVRAKFYVEKRKAPEYEVEIREANRVIADTNEKIRNIRNEILALTDLNLCLRIDISKDKEDTLSRSESREEVVKRLDLYINKDRILLGMSGDGKSLLQQIEEKQKRGKKLLDKLLKRKKDFDFVSRINKKFEFEELVKNFVSFYSDFTKSKLSNVTKLFECKADFSDESSLMRYYYSLVGQKEKKIKSPHSEIDSSLEIKVEGNGVDSSDHPTTNIKECSDEQLQRDKVCITKEIEERISELARLKHESKKIDEEINLRDRVVSSEDDSQDSLNGDNVATAAQSNSSIFLATARGRSQDYGVAEISEDCSRDSPNDNSDATTSQSRSDFLFLLSKAARNNSQNSSGDGNAETCQGRSSVDYIDLIKLSSRPGNDAVTPEDEQRYTP